MVLVQASQGNEAKLRSADSFRREKALTATRKRRESKLTDSKSEAKRWFKEKRLTTGYLLDAPE